MKPIAITTAILACSLTAFAADNYSVFRVCQDQHVIKTSDGAEAGHVEYIVVDPEQQRVVSTIVTGGIIGEKHIAVPFASFHMSGDRDVVLSDITRERFVGAPVVEVSEFTSRSTIEPTLFERSSTYFGGNASVEVNRSTAVDGREGATARGEGGQNDRGAIRNDGVSNVNPGGAPRDGARMREESNQPKNGASVGAPEQNRAEQNRSNNADPQTSNSSNAAAERQRNAEPGAASENSPGTSQRNLNGNTESGRNGTTAAERASERGSNAPENANQGREKGETKASRDSESANGESSKATTKSDRTSEKAADKPEKSSEKASESKAERSKGEPAAEEKSSAHSSGATTDRSSTKSDSSRQQQ